MRTELSLDVDGRAMPAVLALPEGRGGPGPAVVLVHDITGLRDDTRRHAQRFAEAGYVAIAPDLYDGYAPGCVVRTFATMVTGRGGPLPVLAAARAFVAARDDVDASRVGVVGFCMGGGFALLAAADDAYAVAAPFYGAVPGRAERLAGICPTLAQFGARDVPFRSHAARLERHLKALGVPHEVHIYDGAGHGFMNNHPDAAYALSRHTPMRVAYDAGVEAVAWARMLEFFAEHMGAP